MEERRKFGESFYFILKIVYLIESERVSVQEGGRAEAEGEGQASGETNVGLNYRTLRS